MTPELSAIQWVIERSKIIDIVVGVANAMDDKNWQKLRNYLADEIDIDYSEFRGDLPQRIAAELYVQQRVDGLTGLKTLHTALFGVAESVYDELRNRHILELEVVK